MNDLQTNQLPLLDDSEFLPSISPWMTVGGGVLLAVFATTLALSAVLNFKVSVKAQATIRPSGELRVVQPAIEGTVLQIDVADNQPVRAGEAIARLQDSRLQTQKNQLLGSLQQYQLQLDRLADQIDALDAQLLAEWQLVERTVSEAQAELSIHQRSYRDRQVTTQADLQEAVASLELAQGELARYRSLEGTLVSSMQVNEKAAAVRVAEARVQRVRASLNPTSAEVAMAEQRVAQEQARGEASVAALSQQRQQLVQQRIELDSQLKQAQNELQQVNADLEESIIRAPIAGTILQLNLRNRGQVLQPGEAIAYIAPLDAPLVVKAQVNAQDINQVKRGQSVQMRVSACPYPDYGTLAGNVTSVAPDALSAGSGDAAKSPRSYAVTIQPETPFVGNPQNSCQLQAGMEGRADIISREESVLTFVLRKARLLTDL
jgi:HlyD family secretion protein